MIEWKLIKVMDAHGIRPIDLAREMGVTPTAISNLRKEYPRLGKESKNNLMNALNRLRRNGSKKIEIGDLEEHTEDQKHDHSS
jgi:hypothetical protein